MNRIYCIFLLISLIVVPYTYAQMGGNMMGDQKGHGHMEGMMQRHDVEVGLIHHMGQMSRLMQQIRDMMSEKSNAESMKRLSGMMEDMSDHFKRMSAIMKKGDVSQQEMHELDQHNRMMQEAYEKIRW